MENGSGSFFIFRNAGERGGRAGRKKKVGAETDGRPQPLKAERVDRSRWMMRGAQTGTNARCGGVRVKSVWQARR